MTGASQVTGKMAGWKASGDFFSYDLSLSSTNPLFFMVKMELAKNLLMAPNPIITVNHFLK